MSWMEQNDATFTLRFAELSPAGQWTAPKPITSGKDWFVSGVDPPAVIRLRDGSLAAAWYKAVDLATEAYDTLMATSKDDGKTWSKPFSPHHDGTKAQHGFASLFEWPAAQGGGLGMVWLDGRAGADMGLHSARFDGAWKQTAEASINQRVCECCPTSVALASGGPVVAFRDRSPQEVRDIHVVRRDGESWAEPVPVFASHWQVDSCPVNGPAIAASGNNVAVAWFEAPNDEGRAYVAFSSDGGKTFGKPVRVDDAASLGHVGVVLLDDGAAAVTWLEFDNGSRFRVRKRGAFRRALSGEADCRRRRPLRQRHPARGAGRRPIAVCVGGKRRRRTRRADEGGDGDGGYPVAIQAVDSRLQAPGLKKLAGSRSRARICSLSTSTEPAPPRAATPASSASPCARYAS